MTEIPETDSKMQSVHQTAPVPSKDATTRESLRERCEVALRCLPQAPMRDLLARLFEDLLARQWQPIASAPKDGTLILLSAGNGVWVGKHVPIYASGFRPANPWASMLLNHDHMAERYTRPTHWMPLPSAPHHRSADTERHGSDKPESDSESESGFAALRAVPHQPTGERE